MDKHTKIVATLGPASQDPAVIRDLIEAGMNVARLNFSHGSHPQHAERVTTIRRISLELKKPVTILQDLQGPKIRTGKLKDGKIDLVPGREITITTEAVLGDQNLISIDFPPLLQTVMPGSRILLADGHMELQVLSISGGLIRATVILGGPLSEHKGVNFPGMHLEIPSLTPKDIEDLRFGLSLGIDAIAMSFVRKPEDIRRVRQAIRDYEPARINTPIIAKLERPEALEQLHEIIHEADGVMVARGDLGVEMAPETVPIAQKRIIESANRHGKVVITATQMLESMIQNPRPTRAEASDVANAIFDGTDAVMLSGETAVGSYPVKAVEMMGAIIREAEAHLKSWGRWHGAPPEEVFDDAVYITRAARELAEDKNVAAVAVFTESGRTALLMSKERPVAPILAFTPLQDTFQRMSMFWGVLPHLVPKAETVEEMLRHVENAMIQETPIQKGQQIVLICGFPVGAMRPTNLALLHTIGS